MSGMEVSFTSLVDLASERVGGEAIEANDDFFAPKEGLLKASTPIFIPDKYTEFGKVQENRSRFFGNPDIPEANIRHVMSARRMKEVSADGVVTTIGEVKTR